MPRPKAIASVTPVEAEPQPFWRRKTLAQMTRPEWESLCDGCARCCLHKLEEEETGRIHFTNVGCTLLDGESCRCRDYKNRSRMEDCVHLDMRELETVSWLPPTCAYRLVAEGRDLYWWHPLVSGDPETVHAAGVSVRGREIVPEAGLKSDDDYIDYIVQWPGRVPKAARNKELAMKLARKQMRKRA